MKPFDLERALAGDPVVTRDGEPVTQLHVFEGIEGYCLFGVVDAAVRTWLIGGYRNYGLNSSEDLFMAPKTQKRWTVVWINKSGMGDIGDTHNSIEMAEEETKSFRYGHKGYIVPIEWSE